MKTLSTIRMRPKPEHFDLIADKLRDRVDVWATRGTAAKVYLVQDDDELVFSLILDSMDTLIENQDEALSFLDTIRQYLIEYSEDEGLAWLESVDHLLKKDEFGSRTEAVTGFTFNWS